MTVDLAWKGDEIEVHKELKKGAGASIEIEASIRLEPIIGLSLLIFDVATSIKLKPIVVWCPIIFEVGASIRL